MIPLCRTYVVVVRWTDKLLCGWYKWVSRFEAPCIPTWWTGKRWVEQLSRIHSTVCYRDSVVPLRRSSVGWTPSRMGRLTVGFGRRHPVTIRKASLMIRSMWRVWALRHQTGAPCSAAEWTTGKVAVRNVVTPALQRERASLEGDAWCQLFANQREVSAMREGPVQSYSEVFGLGAKGKGFVV